MWQSFKHTKWHALVLGLIMHSAQLVEGCPNDSVFVVLAISVFGAIMAIKRRMEMNRLASKGYIDKGSIHNTSSINSAVTAVNCRSKYDDKAGDDESTRTCSFRTLSGNQSRKWNRKFSSNLRNGSSSMERLEAFTPDALIVALIGARLLRGFTLYVRLHWKKEYRGKAFLLVINDSREPVSLHRQIKELVYDGRLN